VSVAAGARRRGDADIAACAAAVLDDDRFAERLAELELMSRAAMSVPPPAGKQTIIVTCRSGYSARASCEIEPRTTSDIRVGNSRRAMRAAREIADIGLSSKAWFYLSGNYDRP
jgi:hypothetical protein